MRALFAAFCLVMLVAADAPPARRPVEAYAALPFMQGPELSPDGKKVAARIGIRGQQYLAVVPLDRSQGKIQTFAIGEMDVNFWRWVNDDWLIVGVGTESEAEGQKWYVTRLVSVKADGTAINKIGWREAQGQNADDLVWIASDGSPRIRFSMQASIYYGQDFWPKVVEADVTTGRIRTVLPGRSDVYGWYADATGAVRMGVGYGSSGRTSRLLYRPDDHSVFRVVDRADTRREETLLRPVMFLPDPGKAIVLADDANGFQSVYELDLSEMKLSKQLIGSPGYDISGIISDSADTKVLGAVVVEKTTVTRWLDPELAALQASLDKSVKGQRALVVSWSRDLSKFLVHVSAGDTPGSYFVFDRALGIMQRFAYVDEGLKSTRGHPVRTITYKARDGLEIPAILTLPAGRAPKNLPVIVMPHGGPFARDSEDWDWWAQFLADRGYVVIQPNYRGSSGYGTVFAKKAEGQWGLAMQDDLNDALAWLVTEGIADPKRACMVGGSYGGYAAMRAAQRDGKLYRCAVSFAGVSDLARMRAYDRRFLSGAYIDWLNKQAPELRTVSPMYGPEQVSIPMLIVHGVKDRRVPLSQSKLFAEKLKAAGKSVVYAEQPLGDHHFSRMEDRLDFLKRLEAFLAEHNPA